MQKILRVFFAVFVLLFIFPIQVFAQVNITNINSLIENAKQLDNSAVTVEGEAVGEPLERGNYCWVNINDGTNAIGVWMKAKDAQQIKMYGDYKNKGDIVRVSGVFRRACKEHGGEADIHNESMQVIKNGYVVKENILVVKLVCAVILTLILIAAIITIHKFKIIQLPYHF
ncbi:hypothetical protein EDD70_0120 [Hydrogenoanaerobacterium saccharovorans]|uniref:DNA-binding protein n=1 Tax=Hydrogenoanaerobacterium saccharovorans TaxID=474960 RepID=A0A1H8BL78_9FIRM|nr:hypothetical protein [Hydrogenoanaerobacterium saccharovorans]RPF47348.1 hypothetical protein EDD70_0120 [Hydrogenoanaerobacterium saccharovorans]SEM83615.1 hypothetical protein SAMN05216180_1974 [Hydrogenoanaerobacterium saccharovorans]